MIFLIQAQHPNRGTRRIVDRADTADVPLRGAAWSFPPPPDHANHPPQAVEALGARPISWFAGVTTNVKITYRDDLNFVGAQRRA